MPLQFHLLLDMLVERGRIPARTPGQQGRPLHAGKDYHPAFAAYNAQTKIMTDLHTDVWNYGPLKYALSLQMGGAQTYQRPPYVDVTDAQKAAIKQALDQIKALG